MSKSLFEKQQPEKTVDINNTGQLKEVAEGLSAHLAQHPRDAVLLMADYQTSLRNLGFNLKPDVLEHLGSVLEGAKISGTPNSKLYAEIVSGNKPTPELIESFLTPPGSGIKILDPLDPSDLEKDPRAMIAASRGKSRISPIDPTELQGFSLAMQVTEESVNEIVREAFDLDLIENNWIGKDTVDLPELSVSIGVSYDVEVDAPKIEFVQGQKSKIKAIFDASGVFKLTTTFRDLSTPSRNNYVHEYELSLSLSIAATAAISLQATGGQNSQAVFIDLTNISDLDIVINDGAIPDIYEEALQELLMRFAHGSLGRQRRIPISFSVEELLRAGVELKNVQACVIPESDGSPGVLAIGLNSRSGTGNIFSLRNFIPENQNFGFALDQKLFGEVWRVQSAALFPIRDGDLTVHSPRMLLLDGSIYTQVEARYRVFDNCLGSWHIDATAKVWLAFQTFQKDGIWYVKPRSLREEIDMDDWDQFIAELILGFLLSLIGIGSFIGRSILGRVIIEALLGEAEHAIAEQIGGYSFGVFAPIPGTDRIVISSTPVAPHIFRSGVTVSGHLEFRNRDQL